MKNANMNGVLKKAMSDFGDAYLRLRTTIERYERDTKTSVNDLPCFTESYPFDKSFDELDVETWVNNVIDNIPQCNFKVLNYTYLNAGGNTMVGIFEVWLPEENRVVYALTNEEGCTLSVVDYISNALEIDEYDELFIEVVDWGRVTGYEKYFELYRHCLNVYTKDDCKYFGNTSSIQYHLLSDELQQKVTADYLAWLESEGYDTVDTDGVSIIENPDYTVQFENESSKWLQEIKDFQQWHESLINENTTEEERERYYNDEYIIMVHGRSVKLPVNADVFDHVDTLLEMVIKEW